MKRKTGLLFIPLVILTMLASGVCNAKEQDEKKVKEQDDKKMKELVQKAKEKLNNTTWQIELNQMESEANAKNKKKPETDTLYFENNTIKSDKLTTSGFPSTNFTVRVKGDNNDIIVWETMQTSEKQGIAFWRGELLESGVMRGVLSWHVNEKDKRDYTFINAPKEITPAPEIEKEKPAAITEEIATEEAPAVVQDEKPQEAPVEVSATPANEAPIVETKVKEAKEEAKKEEPISKKKSSKKRSLF